MKTHPSSEKYRYARAGLRVLKQNPQQHVRYLPGCEIHTRSTGWKNTEKHRVMVLHQTRIWCAQQGRRAETAAQRIRFSLTDVASNNLLELDAQGNLISREHYYPFGGTALWATRNQTDADDKTLRYSGKERDLTGLYYFGFRYFASWLMRWLNSDPAGVVDGINLFRMVRNNPLTLRDSEGLSPVDLTGKIYSPSLLDAAELLEDVPSKLRTLISEALESRIGKRMDNQYLDDIRNRVTEKINEAALPGGKEEFWLAVMAARKIVNDAEEYEHGSPLNEEGTHGHLPSYIKTLDIMKKPLTSVPSLQSVAAQTISSRLTLPEDTASIFESLKDLHIAFLQNQITLISQQATLDHPELLTGHTPKEIEPLEVNNFRDVLTVHTHLNFATYDTGAFDSEQSSAEENINDFIQVEFVRYEFARKIALLS